jgi:hypothetical protein
MYQFLDATPAKVIPSGTAAAPRTVDNLPSSMSFVQIPDRAGNLAQWVRPVDDLPDLASSMSTLCSYPFTMQAQARCRRLS